MLCNAVEIKKNNQSVVFSVCRPAFSNSYEYIAFRRDPSLNWDVRRHTVPLQPAVAGFPISLWFSTTAGKRRIPTTEEENATYEPNAQTRDIHDDTRLFSSPSCGCCLKWKATSYATSMPHDTQTCQKFLKFWGVSFFLSEVHCFINAGHILQSIFAVSRQ